MSQCQQDLRNAGKPYPRTCLLCGLGPCQKYPKMSDITAKVVMKTPVHPDVEVQVQDQANQFLVIGMVIEALESNGKSKAEIDSFIREAVNAKEYVNLLNVCDKFVTFRVVE